MSLNSWYSVDITLEHPSLTKQWGTLLLLLSTTYCMLGRTPSSCHATTVNRPSDFVCAMSLSSKEMPVDTSNNSRNQLHETSSCRPTTPPSNLRAKRMGGMECASIMNGMGTWYMILSRRWHAGLSIQDNTWGENGTSFCPPCFVTGCGVMSQITIFTLH